MYARASAASIFPVAVTKKVHSGISRGALFCLLRQRGMLTHAGRISIGVFGRTGKKNGWGYALLFTG